MAQFVERDRARSAAWRRGRGARAVMAGLVGGAAWVGSSCSAGSQNGIARYLNGWRGARPLRTPRLAGPPAASVSSGALHPRFVMQDCAICHDGQSAQQPVIGVGQACIGCHREQVQPRPTMHGPAAVGACEQCHTMHHSPRAALVRADDPRLCLDCHESTGFEACGGREQGLRSGCLPCHDPHGSDSPALLRRISSSETPR